MFCLFCYLLIQRNVFAFSENLFRFCCKITKRIGYLMEIKSKRLQKSYQRGATRRFCYLCARYFYDSTFFFCYFAARKLIKLKMYGYIEKFRLKPNCRRWVFNFCEVWCGERKSFVLYVCSVTFVLLYLIQKKFYI